MLNEVSSKDEYLRQKWFLEKDRIANQKKNFLTFLEDFKSSTIQISTPCKNCIGSISRFYSKEIVNIYEKSQHVKEEYNDVVLPLQYLSSFLCLVNNFVILLIFKNSYRFYFASNILLIFCLCIYAEFFVPNQPDVSYSLFIAWSIGIFTIYLLMKVFSTLLILEHYPPISLHNNNQQ